MSFFDDISRINRAHCAALGLPTAAYDRQLSEQERNCRMSESELGGRLSEPERNGRLSLEEIDRLPRIVAIERHGLFDTVSAQIRQLIQNREIRRQRERDAWYTNPTPFRRLAYIERIAKERAAQ